MLAILSTLSLLMFRAIRLIHTLIHTLSVDSSGHYGPKLNRGCKQATGLAGLPDVIGPRWTDFWRMGRDSNPRDACASAGFQDRCLQPLGHPSSRVSDATNWEPQPDCNRQRSITVGAAFLVSLQLIGENDHTWLRREGRGAGGLIPSAAHPSEPCEDYCLLPREEVANDSAEAVEHEHRDTHESKLPKWIPHENLDGVFNSSAR
jgi:hypothetical protein